MLRADADAGVCHRQNGLPLFFPKPHDDQPAVLIVLDGVVHEVEHDPGNQLGNPLNHGFRPFQPDADVFQLRRGGQLLHGGLRRFVQIDGRPLHVRRTLVQPGQAQGILHQINHALRLAVDFLPKVPGVLRRNQPVLHQLGVAGNGMERGFQLMGNVGGEFPAKGFRLLLLGHVKQQQHHAENRPVGSDRTCGGEIFPVGQGDIFLRLFPGEGFLHQCGNGRVPVGDAKVRT